MHGDEGEDAAEDAEDAEGVRDGHDARAYDGAGEVEHRQAGLLRGVGMGNGRALVALAVRGVPRPPSSTAPSSILPSSFASTPTPSSIDADGMVIDITGAGVRSL